MDLYRIRGEKGEKSGRPKKKGPRVVIRIAGVPGWKGVPGGKEKGGGEGRCTTFSGGKRCPMLVLFLFQQVQGGARGKRKGNCIL